MLNKNILHTIRQAQILEAKSEEKRDEAATAILQKATQLWPGDIGGFYRVSSPPAQECIVLIEEIDPEEWGVDTAEVPDGPHHALLWDAEPEPGDHVRSLLDT